jgi:hypothetical protein
MPSLFTDVLSDEELQYLNTLPEVLAAKASLEFRSSGMVYFSVPVTDSIRATLQSRFGLQLTRSSIPMRWMKGDTAPHIDTGASHFDNTYLLYLNDSPGELIIDSHAYPIRANSGFVFNEGLTHETQHTENVPRLLLGPMNEWAEPVGASVVFYYPTETDALANTNLITAYGSYTVQNVSGYTHWRLASTSTGPSPKNVVYTVGDILDGNNVTDFYYLYPTTPCFKEGTQILCQIDGKDVYRPIETLTTGTLVKTSRDGYKKVVLVGKGTLQNPGTDERIENRLYKCSPEQYPELTEDLFITGCHSILVDSLTESQRLETVKHLGKVFVTDRKYRLMACLDERATPFNSEGTYSIYHLALEHEDGNMNYGVYANGGLLVETCCLNSLRSRSNMTFSAP